nr:hypothetical protein [uncultured Acidocella sp.]
MAKYDPLCNHLKTQSKAEIVMTFQEIEAVLGSKLPPSAHKHSAWWAKGEAGRHVQKRAWLDAGYIVENLDQFRQRVTFKRSR